MAEPWRGIPPVLRRGARPGDGLYVTGRLGGSRLGRHLSFMPRVAEAKKLAATLGGRLHAMIDISDGLAIDVRRLGEASDVGAVLDEGWLEQVASRDAAKLAVRQDDELIDHVLGDGEDFELLLAVEGAVHGIDVPLWPVGTVTGDGFFLQRSLGDRCSLPKLGYVH